MSAGCSGCDMRWTSLSQAHCTLCHRQFASVGVADKHHRYDQQRRATCLDPAQMRTKKGLPVYRLDGRVWRTYERNTSFGGDAA